MTKLEEVAWAIQAAMDAKADSLGGGPHAPGDQWWSVDELAFAAIEALREPTAAMVARGTYLIPGEEPPAEDDAKEIWQGMIDVVLNEKPQNAQVD